MAFNKERHFFKDLLKTFLLENYNFFFFREACHSINSIKVLINVTLYK